MWQTLRAELHTLGVEVVTVSMELSGPEASRPFIEAARPEHPSLLDPTHKLYELFGVVNIPNVIWIDERGMIVRPAEPGWPGTTGMPADFMAKMVAARTADVAAAPDHIPAPPADLRKILGTGQDRTTYADAIRDWAHHGSESRFALSPDEVIEASLPRSLDASRGAAHFELANHLWQTGDRVAAIGHFNECHRLQPDNWTFKRQAWSLVGRERLGDDIGPFMQNPQPGHEADWPFISSFDADVAKVGAGHYYPKTM